MECSFCGEKIPTGEGKVYVKKNGKSLYFCSSKCEKNMLKLGRKPRNVEWTNKTAQVKSSE